MTSTLLGLLLLAQASYARPELLVSTDWLAAHLDDANVRVVDTRTQGYEESHIPGAVWLGIDASRDKNNPPTFLPSLHTFVETLETLGISNDTRVVFYDDRAGIYGTRPWVLLKMLGHDNAAILSGGWPEWTSEGRATTADKPAVSPGTFHLEENPRWIVTADDVAATIGRRGTRIVDARSEAEYRGEDLRGNPRGGSVPSAIHLDWEETLSEDEQTLKPASELQALFERAGLSKDEAIVTYCQGAGRAAHELFVLYLMGYDDVALYMGSWEDWSRREELPVE
jgi:thiosulfate/3-mercaptopyruvate sulfurtransferase